MGKRVFGAAAFALSLACASAGATTVHASDYSSQSEVDPSAGASVTDVGTTSSSATLDGNNYARSFITPGTSIMGAIAATDGSARPSTMTTHSDSWWFECAHPNSCSTEALTTPVPLQLTFGIKVSETQVTNAFASFSATYQLQNGGRFDFSFAQDGAGDFELGSTYMSSTGKMVNLPVSQILADGTWTLTVDATVRDQICSVSSSCVPADMSCDPGLDCSNSPAFTDYQAIAASIDPSAGESDIVDGYDPFTLNIVSLDPNYQFVSADGRTIGGTAVVNAPEPASALLMAGSFGGLWWRRRRAARREGGIVRHRG